MKRSILYLAWLSFSISLLSSCDSAEDPQPRIFSDNVGFEGELPDGSDFGESEIRAANGTAVSGVNQEYSGRHVLIIRSFETGWSMALESPDVLFAQNPPLGESSGTEINAFFTAHYSYETLLEKLLSEKQKADADPNYNSIADFRISLTKEDEYYAYLQNSPTSQAMGTLRIIKVAEGTQKNLQGQDVRKIELTVEMDLNLWASNAEVQPQQGKLSGVASFKYREDFYQGELEK